MTVFALDTNILSYILRDDDQACSTLRSQLAAGNKCVIPPIAYYEIRRGLLYSNATVKLNDFDDLCRNFFIDKMDKPVWDEAARLYAVQRRRGALVEDADLLIAAFCLVGGYTLVTNNLKHFETIDGLVCVNWK
ncbi:MAG: type II toxin-antitoxin system VapC family toxin [Deltaproteobacteria bacterium]|jgi:predicted nucleic acid-binding protein|nr:type II toxin-antitoxin system VapC family toxin [Deltaproteobacteria bacterium]